MQYLERVTLEKYACENGWELSDRLNGNAVSIGKAGINGHLYFMKNPELGWIMRPSSREVLFAIREKFNNLGSDRYFLASQSLEDYIPVFAFAAKEFRQINKSNSSSVCEDNDYEATPRDKWYVVGGECQKDALKPDHQSRTTNHAEASASANNSLISNLSSLTSKKNGLPRNDDSKNKVLSNLEAEFNNLVTEVEAVVKQRRHQEEYRSKLENYWNNACAVTGIEIPEILRASHAKPWKDSSDTEKLDVFNGFLLCANLDALFDKGLITFDDEGKIIISPKLTDNQIASLNLQNMRLRKIDPCHLPYLAYHRENIFK